MQGRVVSLVLGGLAMLGALGCNALFGVDELTEGSPSTGAAPSTGTSGAATGVGAAGTTSSGGPGGMVGTGGSGAESCFNGADDDGDDDVDCADADCGPVAACDALPAGFEGFASLRLGATADEACGGGYGGTIDGGVDPQLPPASCSACDCAAPTGQACNNPHNIDLFENASCTVGGVTNLLYTFNTCFFINISSPDDYVRAEPRLTTGGSCAPIPASPTGGAPSFGETARICQAVSTGACETPGESCVPADATCVMATGDVPCPNAYSAKTLVYTGGFTDGRDCAACTCGTPSAVECVVTTDFYLDSDCNDLDVTWVHDTSCGPAPFNGIRYYDIESAVPGAGSTCTPSGGAPGGSIVVDDPVTICCP